MVGLNIMNSNLVWQTVVILTSWLPSCFILFSKHFISGFNTVKAELISLCIICSLGQENFLWDKYI